MMDFELGVKQTFSPILLLCLSCEELWSRPHGLAFEGSVFTLPGLAEEADYLVSVRCPEPTLLFWFILVMS